MYRADDPEAFDEIFKPSQTTTALGFENAVHASLPVTNPWVSENNTIWNTHMCCLLPRNTYSVGGTTAAQFVNSWEEGVALGDVPTYRTYIGSRHQLWQGVTPEQLFVDPVYTQDELDATNDIITQCKSYVNECIASFALGTLDPVNDWETYKNNLASAGLDQWVELAQTYWTRSH